MVFKIRVAQLYYVIFTRSRSSFILTTKHDILIGKVAMFCLYILQEGNRYQNIPPFRKTRSNKPAFHLDVNIIAVDILQRQKLNVNSNILTLVRKLSTVWGVINTNQTNYNGYYFENL